MKKWVLFSFTTAIHQKFKFRKCNEAWKTFSWLQSCHCSALRMHTTSSLLPNANSSELYRMNNVRQMFMFILYECHPSDIGFFFPFLLDFLTVSPQNTLQTTQYSRFLHMTSWVETFFPALQNHRNFFHIRPTSTESLVVAITYPNNNYIMQVMKMSERNWITSIRFATKLVKSFS